jgi:hypothetical protein
MGKTQRHRGIEDVKRENTEAQRSTEEDNS